MGFKKIRSVPLSDARQGLIRYTCLNYANQPERVKRKIDRLCREVGEDNERALRKVMCTQRGIRAIAGEEYIQEGKLYALRRKFYMAW